MINQDINKFIHIEGMTPNESKNRGENLEIHFSFEDGPFGKMIVASTPKGLCYMGLVKDESSALETLKERFPMATYKQIEEVEHQNVQLFFSGDWSQAQPINLHVKGTDFQIKVWEALLRIPMGKLVSYGDIARETGHPKACRAVGSAVGDNPVFFIIPCHRVIQASGNIGNYYWGTPVKKTIIEWESARAANE